MAKYRTSLFIREYGATLKDIAEKYNMSMFYIRILHLQDKLHDFIAEQESKATVVK